jgi:hypothetical protein
MRAFLLGLIIEEAGSDSLQSEALRPRVEALLRDKLQLPINNSPEDVRQLTHELQVYYIEL